MGWRALEQAFLSTSFGQRKPEPCQYWRKRQSSSIRWLKWMRQNEWKPERSGTGFKSAVDLTNYLFSSRKTTMKNAQTWNSGNLERITKWTEGQSLSL